MTGKAPLFTYVTDLVAQSPLYQGYAWVIAVGLLFFLVLLHRHSGVFFFGSHSVSILPSLFLVATYALLFVRWHNTLLLSLLLTYCAIAKVRWLIGQVGMPAKPSHALNAGLFSTCLVLYHPVAIMLFPFELSVLTRRHPSRVRMLSGYLLGVSTVLWLAFVLAPEPTLTGWGEWTLARFVTPWLHLIDVGFPYPLLTVSGGILLGMLYLYGYPFRAHAIERHRNYYSVLLSYTTLLFVFYLVADRGLGLTSPFLLASYFVSGLLLQLLFKQVQEKVWLIGASLVVALLWAGSLLAVLA